MNDVRTSISTRHLLLRYLRPQGRRIALLGALLLATTGLQLLNPQIVRVFIDTATTGGSGQTLTLAALLFVGVAVAGQVLSVWITYLGENVAWAATNRLREDLAEHCLGLDMPFHNTRTAGEFIERIDGDINALSQVFSQFTLRLVGSGLLLVGVLIVVFREDTLVGLALLGFAVVILLFLNRSRAIAVPYNTAERQSAAALFGFIEERLAGLEDLRPNGAGAYVMRRFHERLRDYFGKAWRASRWGTYLWSTTALLFGVGYVGALALGGSLYLGGAITIGTVFLFYQYTQMLR